MSLELKHNTKPVCSRHYPVPRVHESMFRNEVEILVKLGVIEEANDSEWGAPYFAQPKEKTNRIIFLSGFWNLNRKIKCKPYPVPKIRKILLNPEVFKDATSLE